jgi:hypothetical protein
MVIQKFHLNLKSGRNKFIGACPVHGGDNPTSFNLYPYSGIWVCRTHGCHEKYGKSIHALIKQLSLRHQIEYKGTSHFETQNVTLATPIFVEREPEKEFRQITINSFLRHRVFPCPFFSKKFGEELTKKHFICYDPRGKSDMMKRTVVPILSDDKKYVVAYQGRTISPKCEKCGSYHINECKGYYNPKWKMGKDCLTRKYIYNSWNWDNSKTAFLTESVGNVLFLERLGIRNPGATLGTQFNDIQLQVLLDKGIKKVIYIPDAGEAGMTQEQRVAEMVKPVMKYDFIDPFWDDDIAELETEDITKFINLMRKK